MLLDEFTYICAGIFVVAHDVEPEFVFMSFFELDHATLPILCIAARQRVCESQSSGSLVVQAAPTVPNEKVLEDGSHEG